jgi:hypothetical protein
MAKRALTAAQVAALEEFGVHRIVPSLYIQIRPQGTRSWLFRYGRDGHNLVARSRLGRRRVFT